MVDARTPMDVRPLPALRVVVDDEPAPARAEPIDVVLACSSADAEAITASAEVLGIPGLRVLTGVDQSTDSLRVAVLRATVPTLFVVCRGGGLDADRARDAAASFGSRRLVHHRLLVAQYEAGRPGPWMTAVRRAWTSMNASLEVCSGHVAGMVASSEYSVVGGEVSGVVETVERRASGAPFVRIAPASALASALASGVASGRMSADDDSPLRDRVGTIPAHVRAPGSNRRSLAVVSTRDTEDDGPAAKSDAVLVRDPPPRNAVATPPGLSKADRTLRMAASAVVAVVVVSFAAVPTLGERHAVSPAAAPSDRFTIAIAPAVAETPVIDHVPQIHAGPIAITPTNPTVAIAAPPTESAPTEVAPPPPGTQQAAETEGRVAALFVIDGPNVALAWHAAANTCRARQVDGTRGFRLPNIDELRWLRRTGRVRPGRAMWSGSRVQGESESNWIVDGKGTMARLGKDAAAFVVCVRVH